jgi:hypothetical protein
MAVLFHSVAPPPAPSFNARSNLTFKIPDSKMPNGSQTFHYNRLQSKGASKHGNVLNEIAPAKPQVWTLQKSVVSPNVKTPASLPGFRIVVIA